MMSRRRSSGSCASPGPRGAGRALGHIGLANYAGLATRAAAGRACSALDPRPRASPPPMRCRCSVPRPWWRSRALGRTGAARCAAERGRSMLAAIAAARRSALDARQRRLRRADRVRRAGRGSERRGRAPRSCRCSPSRSSVRGWSARRCRTASAPSRRCGRAWRGGHGFAALALVYGPAAALPRSSSSPLARASPSRLSGLLALEPRRPRTVTVPAAGLFFSWFDAGVGLGGPVVGLDRPRAHAGDRHRRRRRGRRVGGDLLSVHRSGIRSSLDGVTNSCRAMSYRRLAPLAAAMRARRGAPRRRSASGLRPGPPVEAASNAIAVAPDGGIHVIERSPTRTRCDLLRARRYARRHGHAPRAADERHGRPGRQGVGRHAHVLRAVFVAEWAVTISANTPFDGTSVGLVADGASWLAYSAPTTEPAALSGAGGSTRPARASRSNHSPFPKAFDLATNNDPGSRRCSIITSSTATPSTAV